MTQLVLGRGRKQVTLSVAPQLVDAATGAWRAATVEADGRSLTDLTGNGRHLLPGGVAGPTPTSNDPTGLLFDGTRYVYLDGVAGTYASVPDEAALDITGDIDISVDVALDDWTPSNFPQLVNRNGLTTGGGYGLRVLSTAGTLRLQWSDGTSAFVANSTAATGLTDGERATIRATLDVDNGAGGYDVTFYVNGVQLGAVVTGGATTSIGANSDELGIGAFRAGASDNAQGQFYGVTIKDGIDGTTVLDVDFTRTDLWPDGSASTSGTAVTGQTVTLNGRATLVTSTRLSGDAVDDYASVADDDAFDVDATDNLTAVTVFSFAEIPSATAWLFGHSERIAATVPGWMLYLGSSGLLVGRVQDGTSAVSVTAAVSPRDVHVAALRLDRTAETLELIVDGAVVSTQSVTGIGSLASTFPVTVFARGDLASNHAPVQQWGQSFLVGEDNWTDSQTTQLGRELAVGEAALAVAA